MADDIQTDVIESMVDSVSKRFDIARNYYKLKSNLLKVPKLKYHERNVEYGKTDIKYSFSNGANLLEKVLSEMDKELLEIYLGFINEGRIDVFPKKGKKDGAYAIHNLITQPTYLLLNWTNRLDDVRYFAHEMGHGIHYELVRKKQNAINFDNPTSTAEVASTFFEDFVIQELLKKADNETKLSLMMSKLNQDVSSIFRQIAFYNFETDLHYKFRKQGYLSEKEIGKLFQKHMKSYMGNYVEQSPGSGNWWIYVDHFRLFFYVYSYAGGLLISKSLQVSVKKDPKFIGKVKEFLSAGTSDSPKNILKKLDIDITHKKFWDKGLTEVDTLLKETKKLAKKFGKI
jgi:oligoendopeptidase F